MDGHWAGTTDVGEAVTFDISNNGSKVTSFVLTSGGACYSPGTLCSFTVYPLRGPMTIVNNQFSYTSSDYSFTGEFISGHLAGGTYRFVNFGPFCNMSNCYLNRTGTWSANPYSTPTPGPSPTPVPTLTPGPSPTPGAPVNDECTAAIQIPSIAAWPVIYLQDTRGATVGASDPSACPTRGNGHSVWYRWTAPDNGLLTLQTCGSNYDTVMGIWESSECGNLGSPLACNDDSSRCGGSYSQSYLSLVVRESRTYLFAITSYSGTPGGELRLSVSLATGLVVSQHDEGDEPESPASLITNDMPLHPE